MHADGSGDEGKLLSEQIDYYRAVAEEYFDGQLDEPGADELVAAVEEFRPHGDVLEFGCGPGTWTLQLLRHADTVTALDASEEMQGLARQRVAGASDRVRFVVADLFSWTPDRGYDAVFMGFWLSHVPWSRFDDFWALVERCLAPGGRVCFVDDAYRTPDELIEGADSSTIQRRLQDGTRHRAVKVPHTAEGLQRELSRLGWNIAVHQTSGPFYWGAGERAVNS